MTFIVTTQRWKFLPSRYVLATDEKYNEAILTAKRLVAAIDGLPDPGGPNFKENKRESNFKSKEETEEKRGQFSLVVGGLLDIAFVVPVAQTMLMYPKSKK